MHVPSCLYSDADKNYKFFLDFHEGVFQMLSVLLELTLFGFISSVSTFGITCCLFRQGENEFFFVQPLLQIQST